MITVVVVSLPVLIVIAICVFLYYYCKAKDSEEMRPAQTYDTQLPPQGVAGHSPGPYGQYR
jgi:hypothetical protein